MYFSEEHEVIDIYWDYFDFVNAGAMKIPIENFFTTNASKTRNPAAINSDSEKNYLRIWSVDFADAADNLSKNETIILKVLTKSKMPISSKQVREKTGLSIYYAREALNSLIEKDYIETLGNRRSTLYKIKQSLEQKIASIKQLVYDLKF